MKRILAAALTVSFALPTLAAPAGAPDGAALYQKHCAMCHGSNGQGGTATPPIAGKEAGTVARMASAHPPPVKKIGLTADDAAAIGRFVAAQKK